MKVKLVVATSAFLIGYMIASSNVPRGSDLLIFAISSFISGVVITMRLRRFWSVIRARDRNIKLLGFEIRKIQDRVHTPETQITVIDPVCDLCGGEEVRIGDNKIKCPKCGSKERKRRGA